MGSGTVKDGEAKEERERRWPSFGLSSLGMGTVFGSNSASTHSPGPGGVEGPTKADAETRSIASSHLVEQSDVVLHDLEEAVDADVEIELVWEKKDIWLESPAGEYEKRRLSWIIVRFPTASKDMLTSQRDDKLLFIVFPTGMNPPFELPPTSATLAVFASLPDSPVRSSVDSSRTATPQSQNGYIHKVDHRTDTQAGIDPSSSVALLELRDHLSS
jgi:hypothetical protein